MRARKWENRENRENQEKKPVKVWKECRKNEKKIFSMNLIEEKRKI